jgi:hypothetical protein
MRVCGKRGWRWWKRSRCAGRRRRAREDLAARRLAPRCVPWNVVGLCGQLSCVRPRPCSCTRAARAAQRGTDAAPHRPPHRGRPPAPALRRLLLPARLGGAPRDPCQLLDGTACGTCLLRRLLLLRLHLWPSRCGGGNVLSARRDGASAVLRTTRQRRICESRAQTCELGASAGPRCSSAACGVRRAGEAQHGSQRQSAARAPPPPPPRSGDSDARVQQQRAGCGKHCRRTGLSQPARNAQQSPEHQGARTRQTEM